MGLIPTKLLETSNFDEIRCESTSYHSYEYEKSDTLLDTVAMFHADLFHDTRSISFDDSWVSGEQKFSVSLLGKENVQVSLKTAIFEGDFQSLGVNVKILDSLSWEDLEPSKFILMISNLQNSIPYRW